MVKFRCRCRGWYEESNAALAVFAPSCLVQNAWGSGLAPSLSDHGNVNIWQLFNEGGCIYFGVDRVSFGAFHGKFVKIWMMFDAEGAVWKVEKIKLKYFLLDSH